MSENILSLQLHTGATMPALGLGTWKSVPGKVERAIEYALVEAGYRHIDCAAHYGNEIEIGNTLQGVFKRGEQKREDIFITSKLWNIAHRKEDVRAACIQSLSDLKLDYLDLYLMHWGVAIAKPDVDNLQKEGRLEKYDENDVLITDAVPIQETWQAMEELVSEGLVKAIGISNFTASMIIDLLTYAKVQPVVNQVELHPFLQQTHLVEFCRIKNIVVTGYSPLGRPSVAKDEGFPVIIEDSTICSIAKKHGKTPAQVVLRWGVQRGTVVIPKSTTPERLEENISIFDFELTEEEMEHMTRLDRNYRFVQPRDWWKIPYFD